MIKWIFVLLVKLVVYLTALMYLIFERLVKVVYFILLSFLISSLLLVIIGCAGRFSRSQMEMLRLAVVKIIDQSLDCFQTIHVWFPPFSLIPFRYQPVRFVFMEAEIDWDKVS